MLYDVISLNIPLRTRNAEIKNRNTGTKNPDHGTENPECIPLSFLSYVFMSYWTEISSLTFAGIYVENARIARP